MLWIIEQIKEFNDKIAIIYNDRKYSYTELYNQILLYYKTITLTIKQGEVIAVLSDYSFNSIAVFFALLENKNIIVPVTVTSESEIIDRITVSNIEKTICFKDGSLEINNVGQYNEMHPLISRLRESRYAGLILFSSGSTGKPKAMIHNLNNMVETYRNKKAKNFNFLVFLMFDHIGGLNTMFNCISMGVTITIPVSRDADYICGLVEKYNINILPASPTFLNLILISEAYLHYNLCSLLMITYGTEPMPESLLLRLREAFPKVKFLQTFGTSETGIAQANSKSSGSTLLKIDDPNLEYKIVDNELWLRSKTQILGYLNASMERFTEDGWFRTGDLVETSDDGYIRIIGRNSEIINVGGQKVLPAEVESFLLQLPVISDCLVYGEKNAITGMSVVADVVLAEGYNNSEIKKEIRKQCKGKIDDFKIPTKINVVNNTSFSDRFKKMRIKNEN